MSSLKINKGDFSSVISELRSLGRGLKSNLSSLEWRSRVDSELDIYSPLIYIAGLKDGDEPIKDYRNNAREFKSYARNIYNKVNELDGTIEEINTIINALEKIEDFVDDFEQQRIDLYESEKSKKFRYFGSGSEVAISRDKLVNAGISSGAANFISNLSDGHPIIGTTFGGVTLIYGRLTENDDLTKIFIDEDGNELSMKDALNCMVSDDVKNAYLNLRNYSFDDFKNEIDEELTEAGRQVFDYINSQAWGDSENQDYRDGFVNVYDTASFVTGLNLDDETKEKVHDYLNLGGAMVSMFIGSRNASNTLKEKDDEEDPAYDDRGFQLNGEFEEDYLDDEEVPGSDSSVEAPTLIGAAVNELIGSGIETLKAKDKKDGEGQKPAPKKESQNKPPQAQQSAPAQQPQQQAQAPAPQQRVQQPQQEQPQQQAQQQNPTPQPQRQQPQHTEKTNTQPAPQPAPVKNEKPVQAEKTEPVVSNEPEPVKQSEEKVVVETKVETGSKDSTPVPNINQDLNTGKTSNNQSGLATSIDNIASGKADSKVAGAGVAAMTIGVGTTIGNKVESANAAIPDMPSMDLPSASSGMNVPTATTVTTPSASGMPGTSAKDLISSLNGTTSSSTSVNNNLSNVSNGKVYNNNTFADTLEKSTEASNQNKAETVSNKVASTTEQNNDDKTKKFGKSKNNSYGTSASDSDDDKKLSKQHQVAAPDSENDKDNNEKKKLTEEATASSVESYLLPSDETISQVATGVTVGGAIISALLKALKIINWIAFILLIIAIILLYSTYRYTHHKIIEKRKKRLIYLEKVDKDGKKEENTSSELKVVETSTIVTTSDSENNIQEDNNVVVDNSNASQEEIKETTENSEETDVQNQDLIIPPMKDNPNYEEFGTGLDFVNQETEENKNIENN